MARTDHLRIRRPCPLRSLTLTGSSTWCDHCEEHVHDLSDCTQAEAEAILARPDVRCVAIRPDAAGRAVFRPAVAALAMAACTHAADVPYALGSTPSEVEDVRTVPGRAVPGRIDVHVVDPRGAPLHGAKVLVRASGVWLEGRTGADGRWTADVDDRAGADAEGRMVLELVAPGRSPATPARLRFDHDAARGTAMIVVMDGPHVSATLADLRALGKWVAGYEEPTVVPPLILGGL